MVAGTVPAANLGALAAFLLTGQSSRDVVNRTDVARATPPPPTPAAEPPPPAQREPAPAVKIVAAATVAEPVAPPPKDPPAAPPVAAPPKRAKKAEQVAAVSSTPAAAPGAAGAAGPAKPAQPAAIPAAKPEPAKAAPQQPPEPAKPSLAAAPPADPARSLRLDDPGPAGRGGSWMRPAAYGAGAAAIVFLVLAVQQGLDARSGYADADAMLGGDGSFLPGGDPARYDALVQDADSAKRNAYLSAGATVVFAAAAGYLGWKSIERAGPEVAFRF